jgi:hypothetical protein
VGVAIRHTWLSADRRRAALPEFPLAGRIDYTLMLSGSHVSLRPQLAAEAQGE